MRATMKASTAVAVAALAGLAGEQAFVVGPAGASGQEANRPPPPSAPGGAPYQVVPRSSAASALAVSPLSATGCTGNLPSNNVKNCISIVGSGSHVTGMAAIASIRSYPIVAHLQLYGPGLNMNTTNILMEPTNDYELSWAPDATVKSGQYCATTWQLNGTGGYMANGPACETVS